MMKSLFEPENYASIFDDRLEHLVAAAGKANVAGYFLEFGVWKGTSLGKLANSFPEVKFTGFDSFEGLPETWTRSFDGSRKSDIGAFKLDAVPKMPHNVDLVVGYFAETLPNWLKVNCGMISFVHIDSDLYSSAKIILELLTDRLATGAIIAFDELCDWNEQGVYERWREGEARALSEWCDAKAKNVLPLYRTNWIEGSVLVAGNR